MNIENRDREILRDLAGRVREIAEQPEMARRKERWYRHNALESERPMVLCFPEGAWNELLPRDSMECSNEKMRQWEWRLRSKIYWWEHIRDDNTLESYFDLNWHVSIGDYGVSVPYTYGEGKGSYTWEPPLKDLAKDIDKLHFRELSVDRKLTQKNLALADELFGDLLKPRIRGSFWWTMGLTWEAIKLIGLEKLMLFTYDQPEQLHRLLEWLSKEHMHFIRWFEREGLLSLNNEDGYTGSGGVAYTHELPQSDWKAGSHVRLKDLWGFSESQETVGISPDMFGQFIFPYQLPLLEQFGLNCYGCCEAVHERWDYIKQVPNLRRVSVAPWCNERIIAEKLENNYVYSRKPNPAPLCVGFDESSIRSNIRKTLEVARGCNIEIIMKDTHTVEKEPSRITKWVEIAFEEIQNNLSKY